MGKHFDAALKLLAADKVEEAQQLADSIEAEISEMEDDHELITEMIEHKRGPAPSAKSKTKPQLKLPLESKERKPKLRLIPENERSAFIKQFALEMANGNGGKVVVGDVVQAIAAAGKDLGTNIPGTVVAN